MDLGFEQAGFTVGLAYDIRPHAVASWNRNRPSHHNGHIADLSVVQLKDIDRTYGQRFIPSGVIGGPPCQSFSRANRSQSNTDPRRKLIRQFFSIALRFHRWRRPLDFILMENVPALAKADNGKLLQREIDRLVDHGFLVHSFVIDAANYSVPQYRKRLFLLAVPKNKSAMQHWLPPNSGDATVTVKDAIHDLPVPVLFRRGLQEDAIPFHPNHWCMNPKSPRFFNGSLSEGYVSGRSFKTLAWNAPSITAAYGHREVHVHPNGRRRLSVFEAMRLQGFPDTYVLEGTLSAQIDQVSEAVPPPLAAAVATYIKSLFIKPNTKKTDGEFQYPSKSSSVVGL